MERKSGFGFFIVCLAIGSVLAACGGGSDTNRGTPGANGATGATGGSGATGATSTTRIGPVLLSQSQLTTRASALGEPVYWAGPMRGMQYELTRTTRGYLYVRYLPEGVKAGATGTRYLIVATYPLSDAYKALKDQAKDKAVAGPGGSIIYVRPGDANSVLMAFPDVQDQIEVYDPSASAALATAKSGKVEPVR